VQEHLAYGFPEALRLQRTRLISGIQRVAGRPEGGVALSAMTCSNNPRAAGAVASRLTAVPPDD